MGRKRKKLTSVNDKLPPCRICDGPAAGFHYGVNTCDACKGFFHRSLTMHVHYKCQYEQNCKIEFWNKQFCHWCRYQKCLRMGMSKAAIKTGRYSAHKKTKDILEVKQHQSHHQSLFHDGEINDDNSLENIDLGNSSNQLFADKDVESIFYQGVNDNQAETIHIHSNSQACNGVPSECSPVQVLDSSAYDSQEDSVPVSSKYVRTSGDYSDFSNADHQSPPDTIRVQAFSSYTDHHRLPSQNGENSLPVHEQPVESEDFTTESGDAPLLSSSSDLCALFHTCSLSHVQEGVPNPDAFYKDKEVLIERLKESFKTHVAPEFISGTEEEFEQKQKEYVENWKFKKKLFGQLGNVPDSVFDEVFVATGLDIDNRIQRWNSYSDKVGNMVQAMIGFAQAIPGYSNLNMQEKINLIKCSRQEFVYFSSAKFTNVKLGVISCSTNWVYKDEFKYIINDQLMTDFLSLSDKIRRLAVTEEERVLVSAIILMNPDRNDKTQTPAVNRIHWNLIECLLYQMSQRFVNPMKEFANLMSYFAEFQTIDKYMTDFKLKYMSKYASLDEKPLLKELIAGSYLDETNLDTLELMCRGLEQK